LLDSLLQEILKIKILRMIIRHCIGVASTITTCCNMKLRLLAPSSTTLCMFIGMVSFYVSVFNLALQCFGYFEFSVHALDEGHIPEVKCSGCGHQDRTTSLINTHREHMMEATLWLTALLLVGFTIFGLALYEGARTGRSVLVKIFIYWCPVALVTIISTQLMNLFIKTHTIGDIVTAALVILWGSFGVSQAHRLSYRRLYLSPALARVLGVDMNSMMTVLEVVKMTQIYLDNLSDEEVTDPMVDLLFRGNEVTRTGLGRYVEKLMSDSIA